MEQFADGSDGIVRWDGAGTVHRTITQRVDDARLVEDRFTRGGLERWLVDKGGEVILIRQSHAGVVAVDPGHGQFEGSARVETGGARVAEYGRFRPGSGVKNG